jgi:cytochrome c oxidase cbb3-type subunit 3
MFYMSKKAKYIVSVLSLSTWMAIQPVWAAGPPAPSIFDNTLAVSLISLMILLLIIIGILGNILLGAADFKTKQKTKGTPSKAVTTILLLLCLTAAPSLFAQDAEQAVTSEVSTIGGLAPSTFYIMVSVIFLELLTIIVMLINIKFLLKKERNLLITEEEMKRIKETRLSWWDKFNKLKPVSQEAELDTGHEYDGIRELNNRLPPWWLYGFYVTIVFAGIYLWRYHVSHTGPSSAEEYNRSVTRAELKIKEYLKQKGDAVDENTVTLLTAPEDLAEGKRIFGISCATCHKANGAGEVGPNLTDNYWLHGGDVKSIFKTIRYGINAMPQWQNQYSNKQIAQVTSYVKSLQGTNPPNPKEPQGTLEMDEPAAPVADSVSTDKKLASDK